MWRPCYALLARDLKLQFQQKGRLVASLLRPLLWLLVVGQGLSHMAIGTNMDGYSFFMVPGLVAMTLLFGAITAILPMAQDKESGIMRMLLLAPFSPSWIIIIRALGATLIALVQLILFMIILVCIPFVKIHFFNGWFVLAVFLTALVCSAIGVIIVLYAKSLENFAVIMNLVIFPIFFLSGALYPIQHLPISLALLVWLNPFTYGVDLLRHAFQAMPYFSIQTDIMATVGFITATLSWTLCYFTRKGVYEVWVQKVNRKK